VYLVAIQMAQQLVFNLRFNFHLLQNRLITQFIHKNKGVLCCMLENAGGLAQFHKEGTFAFKTKRSHEVLVKDLKSTTKPHLICTQASVKLKQSLSSNYE